MKSDPDHPMPRADAVWALLAWAAAVAAWLAAFWHDWTIPLLGTDLRTWRGHVLVEAREAVACAAYGSLMGGLGWRVMGPARRKGAAALALWSAAAWAGLLAGGVFWGGMALWMLWVLGAMARHAGRCREAARAFLTRREDWNGAFFLLWLLTSVLCDAALLRDAPPGWLPAADALLARLLTHGVLVGGGWIILMLHDAVVPRGVRWLGRVVVIALPLLIAVNTWLQMWWGKGMVEMFGELEVGGRFELERVWAASGLELTPGTVLGVLAVLAGAVGAFGLCGWFSRRRGWRVSPLWLAGMAGAAWMALQVDQMTALRLKERGWTWWERKTYPRRMTWVEPPPGLMSYEVAFHHPRPVARPQALKTRPDVFLFMVESLRADTLRPDIAPYLCRFRDEECQRISESLAASNVTHQSWFSILSGQLPVYMSEARQEKKLALLPAVLKQSGYRVEVRMVNDFSYMDMVSGNFGNPPGVDVMEHVDRESSENFFKVPEREVRMLKRLKSAVEGRAAGGLFAITGMDSTHYNYKWGARFTPPFADYEENPMFPMRPSADEVRRIVNRFWNSVAWVDAQIAEFMMWLKAQGRYDDAIIIVTGDHGEEFKEEGSWFHGTKLNESQTRVPILIKWPKNMGRGPEVARASHLDLLPTLFDALGCEKVLWQDLPGESLLHPPAGGRSIVMSTHFCGKNGEALLLKRGGTEAAFGWRNFWEAGVPATMWLERVEGAGVENWPAAFPDLEKRVFRQVRAR
ncbi:MAG: sulfatase-like hydrolase/transferase [Verrucomicrobiaceae bacterium]|nr:sulfatase-like hydrolase/transferase [Verrucomicrobiaceae bacterium]